MQVDMCLQYVCVRMSCSACLLSCTQTRVSSMFMSECLFCLFSVLHVDMCLQYVCIRMFVLHVFCHAYRHVSSMFMSECLFCLFSVLHVDMCLQYVWIRMFVLHVFCHAYRHVSSMFVSECLFCMFSVMHTDMSPVCLCQNVCSACLLSCIQTCLQYVVQCLFCLDTSPVYCTMFVLRVCCHGRRHVTTLFCFVLSACSHVSILFQSLLDCCQACWVLHQYVSHQCLFCLFAVRWHVTVLFVSWQCLFCLFAVKPADMPQQYLVSLLGVKHAHMSPLPEMYRMLENDFIFCFHHRLGIVFVQMKWEAVLLFSSASVELCGLKSGLLWREATLCDTGHGTGGLLSMAWKLTARFLSWNAECLSAYSNM